MYVDESGDSGLENSPTRYFVLTGMVVHELRWHDTLSALIAFRRRMRAAFGLKLREEIHAGQMLTSPGPLVRIKRAPTPKESDHSYFIQAADTVAFALYQWYSPSAYVMKKGARNYFARLEPALCKAASPKHRYGVVEL